MTRGFRFATAPGGHHTSSLLHLAPLRWCWLILCLALLLPGRAPAQAPPPPAPILRSTAARWTNYTLVSNGPGSRVWQRRAASTNRAGRVTLRTNTVIQLASGLNHLAGTNWVESTGDITITPAGGVATNGQHHVGFSTELNTANAVEIITPDGQDLKTHIMGLSYFDTASGSNILIAELKNSSGLLIASNRVLYPDAFTGLRADVRYTTTPAGVEQDIILRERPPAPAQFGLPAATTRLQVWTEFQDPPAPRIFPSAAGSNDDVNLTFGAMGMGRGRAFFLGDTTNSIPVKKVWVNAQGRTFLVEQVSYRAIAPRLQTLPAPDAAPGSAGVPPAPSGVTPDGSALRHLPDQLPAAPTLLAQNGAGLIPAPSLSSTGVPLDDSRPAAAINSPLSPPSTFSDSLVLDYILVDWWGWDSPNQYQDYDFTAGPTYVINGPVWITGTATIEPGAIIKFCDDPTGNLSVGLAVENLSCPQDGQAMAILTSVDDNSVGEPVGSGSPVTGISNGYLFGGTQNDFSELDAVGNVKIYYACTGVRAGNVWNCEFYHCGTAIQSYWDGSIENVLFSDCAMPLSGGGGYDVGNVTCDAPHFTDGTTYARIVNSLFTGDFNGVEYLSSYDPAFLNLPASIFQSAGAEHYYLANNSPYRNLGGPCDPTWYITSRTTYPPPLNEIHLDTDTPDYGYHYLPMSFDAWLAYYFGPDYVGNPDAATADPDGDGIDNYHEYLAGTPPVVVSFTLSAANQYVSASPASVQVVNLTGAPDQEAVLVDPNPDSVFHRSTAPSPFDTAAWGNFNANPSIPLATTDGRHDVWVGLRRSVDNSVSWQHITLYYNHTPVITIDSKVPTTGPMTMLQITGTSSEPLASLTYDLVDAAGNTIVTAKPADVINSDFDPNLWDNVNTRFECLDVDVTPGVNHFTFHATDRAGNTINKTFTYTLADTQTAPQIKPTFPLAGDIIAGDTFTATGTLDDPTAQITLTVTDGQQNTTDYIGEVERNGTYWFDDIPLPDAQSSITLSAVNAWNESSSTASTPAPKGSQHISAAWVDGDFFAPEITICAQVDTPADTVTINGDAATYDSRYGYWHVTRDNSTDTGLGTVNVTVRASKNNVTEIGLFSLEKPDRLYVESYHWSWDEHMHTINDYYPHGLFGDPDETHDHQVDSSVSLTYKPYVDGAQTGTNTYSQYDTYAKVEYPEQDRWTSSYAWTAQSVSVSENPLVDPNSQPVTIPDPGSRVVLSEPNQPFSPPYLSLEHSDVAYKPRPASWNKHMDTGVDWVHLMEKVYQRKAEIILKYYTGGRAVPTVRNLYEFQVSAAHIDAPLKVVDGPFAQPPYKNDSGAYIPEVTPIAASKISLADLGPVGNDGTLYAALNNNQTVNVRAVVSGDDFYTYSITAKRHKLYIFANGTGLNPDQASTRAQFCVGQKMTFEAKLSPSVAGLSYTEPIWNYNAEYINFHWTDANNCEHYGKGEYRKTINPTVAWFCNRKTQGALASVGLNCHFSNGQQVFLIGRGKFQSFRPVATLFEKSTPYFAALAPTTSPNKLQLGDDLTPNGAMRYKVKVSSIVPFSGAANIIQLVNANRAVANSVGGSQQTTDGEFWLDNTNPYFDTEVFLINSGTLNQTTIAMTDQPCFGLNPIFGATLCSINDSFKDYIVFKPDGEDCISVTLGRIVWSWSASTSKSGGEWSTPTYYIPDPSDPDGSNEFPQWEHTIHNVGKE